MPPTEVQGLLKPARKSIYYLRALERHPGIRTHDQARHSEAVRIRAERLALAARTLSRELRDMENAAALQDENRGVDTSC